jgi:hypothetical protein
VKVGNERLLFQSGPFTYFGISVLSVASEVATPIQSPILTTETPNIPGSFTPDFTVYPVTDLLYMYITRAQYVAAFRASLVERTSITKVDGGVVAKDDAMTFDWNNKTVGVKRMSIAGQPTDIATARTRSSLLAQSNVSLTDISSLPSSKEPQQTATVQLDGDLDNKDVEAG